MVQMREVWFNYLKDYLSSFSDLDFRAVDPSKPRSLLEQAAILERDTRFAAIAIRTLIQDQILANSLGDKKINITYYSVKNFQRNSPWVDLDRVYDLSNIAKHSEMRDFIYILHQMVHAHYFALWVEELDHDESGEIPTALDIKGILVTSDNSKDTKIYYIEWQEWIKLMRLACCNQ